MDTITQGNRWLNAQTLAATFTSSARRAGKYADVRMQLHIPATGTPSGKWELYASEDPQVELDIKRGTDTAVWHLQPLSGDITVTKTAASSGVTLNANDVTSTGASVADVLIKVKTPFTYYRWVYTRTSGTGTADLAFSGRGA